MSELFKSRKKIGFIVGVIFLALTLISGATAGILLGGFLENMSLEGFLGTESSEESSESLAQDEPSGADENPQEDEEEFSPDKLLPSELEQPDVSHVPVYNVPDEMRGVYLVPGYDFLKDTTAPGKTVKAEIDKAVTDAVNFTMNTAIIDTVYNDKVIFDVSGAPKLTTDFDVMEYAVNAARDKGLYVYAIFDASLFSQNSSASSMLSISSGAINKLSVCLREFADKYAPDAILIDGYVQPSDEEQNYFSYLMSGGAIGYDNYLRQTPAALVMNASRIIRAHAPNIQIGLLADAVWASDAEQEGGLPVKGTGFTSLGSGNADTKGFVEQGAVDFVAVKALGSISDTAEPFETVVSWWADVARSSGVPMYVVHAASKAGTQSAGWNSSDQLARQVIKASGVSGYSGSIFDSLSRLVANPMDTTTTLVKYYTGQVKSEHILTELQITKPDKTTFTTQEPSVVFTGASDPTSPVSINGKEITTDSSGYFTVNAALDGGENTFTIVHKGKTLVYKITRNIEILKEIAPTGSISTDGNMSIKLSALAYEDAVVTATVNGTTVQMEIDDTAEDEASRDSNYMRFVGYYTAPAGTSKEQNLGAVTITASWQGVTKSLTGATVKVNKRVQLEDGVPVVVVADQARTYPPNTLDNVPSPSYYPIPKGAMDYAVGNEITYVSSKGQTYKYYNLASGLRVESSNIQPISDDFPGGNTISGINISTEGRYTYLTIKTAQKVSYKISYTGAEFVITFNHTTKNPGGSTSLNQNPIFTKAVWGSDSLALTLAKNGGFMGYKGYYDSAGNLVFRFNSPPSSLSGTRIAIDAGHGGADFGALGFLAAYPEKVINSAIAQMLADELESRGATVLLINNSGNPSLENRVLQAEAFNADMFVSVHNNTATRASAIGTETYYFYPYSKNFSTAIAAQASARLGSDNRGARQSYYSITLSAQMPSVLVECGFLTNKNEYEKLIREDYQQAVAIGIADGLAAGVSSAYTGISSTGSQSSGGSVSATTDSGNVSAGTEKLEELYFTLDELLLDEKSSYTNELVYFPEDADISGVSFKSGNTSVATVTSSGRITGVSTGKATITATSADGKVQATCYVEVVESGGIQDAAQTSSAVVNTSGVSLSSVTDVQMDDSYLTMSKGGKYTMLLSSEKGKVRNSDLLWKSEDTSVATVDSSGTVTAKALGYTEIVAYSADGAYYMTCTLDVVSGSIAVKGISLDQKKIYMKSKTEQQLYVTFNPGTATNKNLSWSSSKTGVATVDSTGKVTAKASGTAIITATSSDGKFKATCEVEVTTKTIEVDSVWMHYSDMEPFVGDVMQLEYGVGPENATDLSVTWKSSNPSVVSVDEYGYITCHKKGTAVITVTSKSNTKMYDTCEVRVV